MAEVATYSPGTFCWLDLGTADLDASTAFYTALLGLTAKDLPAGPDSIYRMLQLRGRDVAALYAAGPGEKETPSWSSYVSVSSADESARKAAELGGKVVAGPFDVMDAGRMAIVLDPEGALFAVWEKRNTAGAQVSGEPGAWCWNELWSRDLDAAKAFYGGLFGWTAKEVDAHYLDWMDGDTMRAGILPITPEMAGASPQWTVYFAVADCEAAIAEVKRLGGTVHLGPTEAGDVGTFATVSDPHGVLFSIIQLRQPAS